MDVKGCKTIGPESYLPWLDITVYLSCAFSLLVTLVTARRLTLLGFLLVCAGTVLWIGIYHFLGKVSSRRRIWLVIGLILLSILHLFSLFLGADLNWLLPSVCVGIVTAVAPRWGLPCALGLWLVSAGALAVQSGGFSLGGQGILFVPFFFSFSFASAFGGLERERQHAQELASALTHSHRELEEAHKQLQAYAENIEELAATRERNRIAREIHDSLGHYLTLLAVQLETASRLEERGGPGLREELHEARRVAKSCLSEVRNSVAALRPDVTGIDSLKERLQRLVSEFESVAKECQVALDLEEMSHPVNSEQGMTLYRCSQEALTNIGKHAQASKVLLRVHSDERQIELTVLDNGQGRQGPSESSGFGLAGMRERVEALGGTVRAGAEPERGWRVEVRLPLASKEYV